MTDQPDYLTLAHEVIEDMRRQGAGLDGTDESAWFVQGALASMAEHPETRSATAIFAYAVYLAETLAATCKRVRVEIDSGNGSISEVRAVRDDGTTQFVLSWALRCVDDPDADNVAFKYAGALRDFDEPERAAAVSP